MAEMKGWTNAQVSHIKQLTLMGMGTQRTRPVVRGWRPKASPSWEIARVSITVHRPSAVTVPP